MITIAIDCGASFTKGAVFHNRTKENSIRRTSPAVHNGKSIFEIQQIKHLVQQVREMIIDLAGGEKEAVLCISNEMHGFILTYRNGEPYTDYISWQKEFGRIPTHNKNALLTLQEDGQLQEYIRFSGMPLRAGLPSTNLFYLTETNALKAEHGELHFYTLGSYLIRALSGKEPMEHPTNAAATGLYDLRTGNWNKAYIDRIGAERIVFPHIGQTQTEFMLDSIKIHALPAVGDQQAALLGADCTKESELSFNLGTGAQVSCLISEPTCADGYQIRPYFYGKYLKTIPHIPSGRALNVYFRFFKSVLAQYAIPTDDSVIWNGISEAASNAEDTSIKVDLGFFENAVNTSIQGSITQINEHDFTMGNLMYAVLKQMADNYLLTAERIQPIPENVERLIFSGGISRKFDIIRECITAHYPQADVTAAYDETLLGLYKYSEM